MNGLEATRCIRAFEGKGPDEGTPIIAMTANVFAGRALGAGGCAGCHPSLVG